MPRAPPWCDLLGVPSAGSACDSCPARLRNVPSHVAGPAALVRPRSCGPCASRRHARTIAHRLTPAAPRIMRGRPGGLPGTRVSLLWAQSPRKRGDRALVSRESPATVPIQVRLPNEGTPLGAIGKVCLAMFLPRARGVAFVLKEPPGVGRVERCAVLSREEEYTFQPGFLSGAKVSQCAVARLLAA